MTNNLWKEVKKRLDRGEKVQLEKISKTGEIKLSSLKITKCEKYLDT